MSRVSRMSLKEILDQVQLILRENDIVLFCDDYNVIQEFIEKFPHGATNRETINKFLIDNEEAIDKEKLILLTVLNYKENLILLDAQREELLKNPETNFTQIANLHLQKREQTVNLERAIRLGKGMEAFLCFYYYDDEEKRYRVDITDSRELIDEKKISDTKNLKRYDEIDLNLKNGDKEAELGMEYIIQSILLTDLYEIFPTEHIGNDIRTMILENEALKKGLKTKEEIQALKTLENCEEYTKFVDNIDFQDMLPDIKATLREYVKYIDIDKLLLISAYRFYEGLENGYIDPRVVVSVKEILRGILLHLKNPNMQISCKLQTKKDNTYDEIDVEYSGKDIRNCMRKFTTTTYLTEKQIDEYKQRIENKEVNISEIEPEELAIIYTKKELEEIAILSDENLKCVIAILDWDKEKITNAINEKGKCDSNLLIELINYQKIDSNDIISLYMNGSISLEQVEKIKEEINLSDAINSYELIQYYKNSIEKDSTEEDKNKFDKYVDIYRGVLIDNKESEELEETYNKLVDSLLDNYQGEEYIKVTAEFYKKGLVTLEVLVEWNEEKIIDAFYKEQIINFEDIEKSNINIEVKQSILGRIIMKDIESYSQEELLNYIYKGYLSEENIFKIYKEALLNETYIEDMLNKGIISAKTYIQILNIGKEILEEQAETKFSDLITMGLRNFSINLIEDEIEKSDISIGDVPIAKKKNETDIEESNKNNQYNFNTRTTETLIDPNIRWEFLKALKCKFPKDKEINNQDPNNPFYNYEFFVIESDNNCVEKDSIVIGERFFKDKFTEEEYATSNATYIWQYKDYLIAQRMLKTEQKKNKKAVLQETEGVVYVANHRPGSWAVSLLYKIAQAKAGESFDKYKKGDERAGKVIEQLEKLYSYEELTHILDLAKIIDDEQKIKLSNGEEFGIVYDVIKEDKRIVDHVNGDER